MFGILLQLSLASPGLGTWMPVSGGAIAPAKTQTAWDGILAMQAELLQDLEVAVAEKDYSMARALLNAGRDMVAVVERDAAQLAPQVGGEGIAAWRYGFEGALASQKAVMIEDLQHQLVQTNGSTVERRQAAQVLGLLVGPSQATQALLHCHTLRVRAAQQHLLKQHSAAGGDPDGVEYAGGLAQRTFLAIGAAAEDVRAVFPSSPPAITLAYSGAAANAAAPAASAHSGASVASSGAAVPPDPTAGLEDVSAVLPTVSALVVQWAAGEARHCAALLCRHALAPFAATGMAVGALLCVGLALVFCAALESSHGLALQVVFREELWPLVEAIVRRHLQRLRDEASSAAELDATNAALQAVAGASAPSAGVPASAGAAAAGTGLPHLPLPNLPGKDLLSPLLPRADLPAPPAAPAGLTALPALVPELRALAEGLAPLACLQAVALLREGVVTVFGGLCEKVHGSLSRLVTSSGSSGKDAGASGPQLASYVVKAEKHLRLFAESDVQFALEPLAKVVGSVAPPELLVPALKPLSDLLAVLPPPASESAAEATEAVQPQTMLHGQSSGLLDRIRAELEAEQERRERDREGWRARDAHAQVMDVAAEKPAAAPAAASGSRPTPAAEAAARLGSFAAQSAAAATKPTSTMAPKERPEQSTAVDGDEQLIPRRRRGIPPSLEGADQAPAGAPGAAAAPAVQMDADSDPEEPFPPPLRQRRRRADDRPAATSSAAPGNAAAAPRSNGAEGEPGTDTRRRRPHEAAGEPDLGAVSAGRNARTIVVDKDDSDQEEVIVPARLRRRRPDAEAAIGAAAPQGPTAGAAKSGDMGPDSAAGSQRRRARQAAHDGERAAESERQGPQPARSAAVTGDRAQPELHRRRGANLGAAEVIDNGEQDDLEAGPPAGAPAASSRHRGRGATGSAAVEDRGYGDGLPDDDASGADTGLSPLLLGRRGQAPSRAKLPTHEEQSGRTVTELGRANRPPGARRRPVDEESDDEPAAAQRRGSSPDPPTRLRHPPRADPGTEAVDAQAEGPHSESGMRSRSVVGQQGGRVGKQEPSPQPPGPTAALAVIESLPARSATRRQPQVAEEGVSRDVVEAAPRARRSIAWDAALEADEVAPPVRRRREQLARRTDDVAESPEEAAPARGAAGARPDPALADSAAAGPDSSNRGPLRRRRPEEPRDGGRITGLDESSTGQRGQSPTQEPRRVAGRVAEPAVRPGSGEVDEFPAGSDARPARRAMRMRAGALADAETRMPRSAVTDDEAVRTRQGGAGGRRSNRFGVVLSDDEEAGRGKDVGTVKRLDRAGVRLRGDGGGGGGGVDPVKDAGAAPKPNRFGIVLSDDEDKGLGRAPMRRQGRPPVRDEPAGLDPDAAAMGNAGRSIHRVRPRAGPTEAADLKAENTLPLGVSSTQDEQGPDRQQAVRATAGATVRGANASARPQPSTATAAPSQAQDEGADALGTRSQVAEDLPGQALTAKQRLAARMAAKAAQSAAQS